MMILLKFLEFLQKNVIYLHIFNSNKKFRTLMLSCNCISIFIKLISNHISNIEKHNINHNTPTFITKIIILAIFNLQSAWRGFCFPLSIHFQFVFAICLLCYIHVVFTYYHKQLNLHWINVLAFKSLHCWNSYPILSYPIDKL